MTNASRKNANRAEPSTGAKAVAPRYGSGTINALPVVAFVGVRSASTSSLTEPPMIPTSPSGEPQNGQLPSARPEPAAPAQPRTQTPKEALGASAGSEIGRASC